jgi:hypothetical protein
MPYSAVTQPRPWPRKKGGTRSSTVAAQMTLVSPKLTKADSGAERRKPGWIEAGRSLQLFLLFEAMQFDCHHRL